MTARVKVAAVQMDVAFGEKAANARRMREALERTAGEGAALTVFPECALTGYCFKTLEEARAQAETIPGPATEEMAASCGRLRAHVVFGMIEAEGERLFNACVLVGPGGVVGSYRKIHLPTLGLDRLVARGDRPFQIHACGDLRLGMNICYDTTFPESSRILALEGADLVVLPTNWPTGAETVAEHVVNVRALENRVYYMAVNRIGEERGFRFIGRSRICDPEGRTLTEAPHDKAAILYAEIDPAEARNKHIVRVPRQHEIDRFADRRPEMYQRILSPVEETVAADGGWDG